MSKRLGNALNRWTPIHSADDLPPGGGPYLLTVVSGTRDKTCLGYLDMDYGLSVWRLVWGEDGDIDCCAAWWWKQYSRHVTAWRPMPAPYEKEAQG